MTKGKKAFTYLYSYPSELILYSLSFRIDLTVIFGESIYILEFKVDGKGEALQQIKDKNYQQKYRDKGRNVYLIGIDFDSEAKNIGRFAWELV